MAEPCPFRPQREGLLADLWPVSQRSHSHHIIGGAGGDCDEEGPLRRVKKKKKQPM